MNFHASVSQVQRSVSTVHWKQYLNLYQAISDNDQNLERNFCLNNEPKTIVAFFELCLGETGSVFSVRGSSLHSFLRWTIWVFDIPSLCHQNQWSQKCGNLAELFLAPDCSHVGRWSLCVEVIDPNHSLNNSSSISVYCSNICWIKYC